MKVALCEIKENIQGTNNDRKETRTHINSLEQKEERNIQPEQNEEFKKMRRSLGTSRTSLNVPTSKSWGCQKKRKSKKLKTYLKK